MSVVHRDGQVASFDIPFVEGTDHRLVDFSNVECLAFLRLWALAVKLRRHLLPGEFATQKPHVLASLLRVHRKCATQMRRKCTENGLIRVIPEDRILVVGVGIKHHWLIFYDGPNGEDWPSKGGERVAKTPQFGGENATQGSRKKVEGSSAEALRTAETPKLKPKLKPKPEEPVDPKRPLKLRYNHLCADPNAWQPADDDTNFPLVADRWPIVGAPNENNP